eukprot:TRINITY_DN80858_c0_g1_i1.p1 TRINITY_DN80858_c0_g1~~TRINITY_DN80858_c0_g1_i1.p1  ORF type:complete len:349 (-),score=62.18 TRINITY_DN80858_c0_g1_i1:58-1104(-)
MQGVCVRPCISRRIFVWSMYGIDLHFSNGATAKRVLVTGAGGRTGRIIVRKLLERGTEAFTPTALVRDEKSEQKLRKYLGHLAMVDLGLTIVRGDVTKPETCAMHFEDKHAVIIATGAKPCINRASLAGVIAMKVATLGLSSAKPSFWFEEGQAPEQVDWHGQKNQVDAAKSAGVKHVVMVSSMGGTKPGHFLNTNLDGMVLWKRKAERYLVASSVPYTVIHAGGLLPHTDDGENAPGGKRQLFVGLDDVLLEDDSKQLLPREDLAEVSVQCLIEETALNRSFDLGSGPEGEGTIYGGSLHELLRGLQGQNCLYSLASDKMEPSKVAASMFCLSADTLGDGDDSIKGG